jgi:glucose/arabinose dehydrogenase
VPGHQHGRGHFAEIAQAGAGRRASTQEISRRQFPSRNAGRLQSGATAGAKKPPRGKLRARVVIDGKLEAPSGFAIGPDGDLYVAERLNKRVRRFSAKGKKKGMFIKGLPDMPEFLAHVADRA